MGDSTNWWWWWASPSARCVCASCGSVPRKVGIWMHRGCATSSSSLKVGTRSSVHMWSSAAVCVCVCIHVKCGYVCVSECVCWGSSSVNAHP